MMSLCKRSIAVTVATLLTCLGPLACASRSRVQASAVQLATMVYFLRVVDGQSQAPVNKAKVTIELNTSAKPNWSGLTDAGGFFQFTWNANHDPVQARISVQAPGFASFDQHSLLLPDKLIELKREQK